MLVTTEPNKNVLTQAPLNINFSDTLAEAEQKFILFVLSLSGGNKTLTAKRLDIGIRTLQRKLAIWRTNH